MQTRSPTSTVIFASPRFISDATSSNSMTPEMSSAPKNSKLTSPPGDSAATASVDTSNRATAPVDGKDSSDSNSQQAAKPPDKKEGGLSPTPQAQSNSYPQGYPAHLTPQPGAGYYIGYQSQVTPEPPSPAGPGGAAGAAGAAVNYDVGSFFQQPASFAPHASPFGVPNTPLSPRRNGGNLGVIPPASPLFPRVTATGGAAAAGLVATGGLMEQQPLMDSAGHHPAVGASPSLSVPYLSPPLGPASMYQSYPVNSVGSQSDSPEDASGWNDRNQQTAFQQGSPQINAQGIPVPYVPGTRTGVAGGRSYSFDNESMLPPSAIDQQEQVNPAYSPYTTNQNGSGAAVGGTLFAHQQPWGYPAHGEMYGNPGSPLQPRPTAQMPVYPGHGMGGGIRHMGLYGQYYPATSPGPPIQTTDSNKGPDGANLFIFHIPNHFTNADMYQLFCPYGNLLSVRIMVEKDTGRSRGFGFVSYDSPASAALAIKELNGFAIGNKRLKVQHKQIRPSDQQNRESSHGNYGMGSGADGYQRTSYASSLPPSGPMAAQGLPPTSPWYDTRKAAAQPATAEAPPQDRQDLERNPESSVAKSPATDNAALSGTTNESSPGVVLGNGGDTALSPLASLEPLRNALPDVTPANN